LLIMPTVARLNVTPMKGTRLHHPGRVDLSPTGIPGNRRFFLVDERGELFSGADDGRLVQIRADQDERTGTLHLTFPDGTAVAGPTSGVERVVVNFYGRPVSARILEGELSPAVSAFLGRDLRLVICEREGDGTDVHHLTLVSTASVEDLARRGAYTGTLDARRFRLDLELDGCEPFEEDTWHGRLVEIGGARIRVHGQIPRCRVTTQSPETGAKDWNTLTQIAKFRPRILGDGGLPFGMYAEVEVPGSVALGDRVEPSSAMPPAEG
jgi:uncharacterized protein